MTRSLFSIGAGRRCNRPMGEVPLPRRYGFRDRPPVPRPVARTARRDLERTAAGVSPPSPLVTVLTPVHDAEDHPAECIASVVNQTYEHWTCVIVDNCSTDRTPEIVRSFAERHPRHVGDGAYTKVVDCLRIMVELAESEPRVGLVGAYRVDRERIDQVGVPKGQSVSRETRFSGKSLRGGPYVTALRRCCVPITSRPEAPPLVRSVVRPRPTPKPPTER